MASLSHNRRRRRRASGSVCVRVSEWGGLLRKEKIMGNDDGALDRTGIRKMSWMYSKKMYAGLFMENITLKRCNIGDREFSLLLTVCVWDYFDFILILTSLYKSTSIYQVFSIAEKSYITSILNYTRDIFAYMHMGERREGCVYKLSINNIYNKYLATPTDRTKIRDGKRKKNLMKLPTTVCNLSADKPGVFARAQTSITVNQAKIRAIVDLLSYSRVHVHRVKRQSFRKAGTLKHATRRK